MQPLNIYMLCSATPIESFGQIGLELARHFTRAGIYTNVHSYNRHCPDQDDEIKAITSQRLKTTGGGVFLGYPSGYYRWCAKPGPQVAITMWETTILPPGWVDILNTMDAVVTPCTFCRDLFVAHGVTKPIHVIPLGIGDVYQYAQRPTDRPFTFYACLDRGKRKGGWLALRAFRAAFGDDPDYQLILKSRAWGLPVSVPHENVRIVEQDMSAQELYQLYLQADVCVAPTYGEGFGLIPREFCCSGGIALATDWSGTADDIGLWGVPLPYKLVPADVAKTGPLKGLDIGEWAECDFDALVETMRRVAQHRTLYRSMAKESARFARELYSWKKFAKGVMDVWQGL